MKTCTLGAILLAGSALLAACGPARGDEDAAQSAVATSNAPALPAPDPLPPPAGNADSADVTSDPSDVATDSLAVIMQLWERERYREAFDALVRYRETRPYGRNEVVDYMIATSACRIGQPDLGRALFRAMLYHYALDAESRTLVTRELGRCPPSAALRPVAIASNASGPITAGTRGKLQYVFDRRDGEREVPLANQPVRIVREIPEAEFARRLFAPAQRDSAVASVRALLREKGSYNVAARGPFVIASKHHDAAGIAAIADGLGAFLGFFQQSFRMPAPDHLITIYLAGDAHEMRDLAAHVHGIGLALQSIGYSFRNDLSMVGIIPGRIYGTLAHELFHLMVRRDFGDLPPWLDEGYAALYEVSERRPDGSIQGLDNWRGNVLRMFWGQRPRLDTLLRADWRAFEAENEDVERQAANHATARYFALYLQQHGKLTEVYRALRERPLTATSDTPGADIVREVERVLGEPIARVDSAFVAWFGRLPR